ncbi:phosphotransferase [Deinococcus malanensis]|nr:phosphotransferase [Deinococcus malanensis]
MIRRQTRLHLLCVHPDGQRFARQSVSVDLATYYGENVLEAAPPAWKAQLGRRLSFASQGEVNGVRHSETTWLLHATGAMSWQALGAAPEQVQVEVRAAARPNRTPWFHPDWQRQAAAWISEQLQRRGLRQVAAPRVLKHWQISLLWQVPTCSGPVYFKAVPEHFRHEVPVTVQLAGKVPGAAPPVLACDPEQGFLLMADAGAPLEPDLKAVMLHLAGVQQASVTLIPELNLPDHGPAHIASRLDHLLSDEVLMVGESGGLTCDEAHLLRAARPGLEAALSRLEASSLPRTLGHADLHGGNVVCGPGGLTFLDWSDASLTHPFLDAQPEYFFPTGHAPDPAELACATEAYLRCWTDHASLGELRALHADALRAAELLRALGYVDGIQPFMDDPAEWRGAHLLHLRQLLTGAPEAPGDLRPAHREGRGYLSTSGSGGSGARARRTR